MKLILFSLFISTVASAETVTLNVQGMHCGGCVKSVTKTICKSEEITAIADSCEVKLTDEKNEKGQVTLTTKKDLHWTQEQTQKAESLLKKVGKTLTSTEIK